MLRRVDAPDLGPFDLVIDAAGAGSALSPLRPRALDFGAVWATVPWPEATNLRKDQLRQHYRRADHMAGILPVGRLPGGTQDLAALFWSLPLDALNRWPDTDFEVWRAEVAAFWPAMQPFLAALPDKSALTPARYSHGQLARPWEAALIHIGDAAARASPQLGQGANMALLDAMALSLTLNGAQDAAGVAEALRRYGQMRRWHRRTYQAMSAVLTPMYQSHSRALPLLRDLVLAPLARVPPVTALLSAVVSGDLLPPLAGQRWP